MVELVDNRTNKLANKLNPSVNTRSVNAHLYRLERCSTQVKNMTCIKQTNTYTTYRKVDAACC